MKLSNPADKEYPNNYVRITFPVDDDELTERLRLLSIEESMEPNCYVNSCTAEIPMLTLQKDHPVNADEINYLARRLESLDKREMDKFQAVVYLKDMTNVKDMINLTFNLHNYSLVQDFKDISAIGLQHYLDKNICITESEKAEHDFHALGLNLLMTGNGTVTPLGVIYENGMEMEQLYDGTVFPQYVYKADYVISAYLTRKDDTSENVKAAWFYFPEPDRGLNKALMRLGVASLDECSLFIEDIAKLPDQLDETVMREFSYDGLNQLSRLTCEFGDFEFAKLRSVADYAHADTCADLIRLAENLDQFRFAPKAATYEECGRYLMADAGGFASGDDSEAFDYKKYVDDLICNKNGRFVKGGFVYTESDINQMMHPDQETDENVGFELGGL